MAKYIILRKLKKLLQIICSYINVLIPKQKRVLFYNESVTDNNKYLMNYMAQKTNLEIVCYYTSGNNDYREIDKSTNRVKYITGKLRLFGHLMTCRVMVTSFDHRYIIRPDRRQHFIQLWHGYALKNIGHDSELGYWDKRGTYYTDILCYGDIWKESLCAAFGCKKDQLRIWDNPRNDLLYDEVSKSVTSRFLPYYNKLLVWMPTYRKSQKLHDSCDSSRDIPILDKANIKTINKVLADYGYIMVIKPHPLQNSLKEIVSTETNIFLLDNNDLKKNGIELYHFLKLADALITDYSSVYIDYLKLNRPICFAFDDFEEYNTKRGFAFEGIESLMPGMIVNSSEGLCNFIRSLNTEEKTKHAIRTATRRRLSFWDDCNNCKRISDYIVSLVE